MLPNWFRIQFPVEPAVRSGFKPQELRSSSQLNRRSDLVLNRRTYVSKNKVTSIFHYHLKRVPRFFFTGFGHVYRTGLGSSSQLNWWFDLVLNCRTYVSKNKVTSIFHYHLSFKNNNAYLPLYTHTHTHTQGQYDIQNTLQIYKPGKEKSKGMRKCKMIY